jgi:hypothetical protein
MMASPVAFSVCLDIRTLWEIQDEFNHQVAGLCSSRRLPIVRVSRRSGHFGPYLAPRDSIARWRFFLCAYGVGLLGAFSVRFMALAFSCIAIGLLALPLCLFACGVGLSLLCLWFISVAPVRGGTYFSLPAAKQSRQKKAAHTASL